MPRRPNGRLSVVSSKGRSLVYEKPYEKLGVNYHDVCAQPRITEQFSNLARIVPRSDLNHELRSSPYYYLRCSDTKEARAILEKYDSLSKSYRDRLPIEAFCLAAGVPTLVCMDIVYYTATRLAQRATTIATLIAHEKQPDIIEKAAQVALTSGGFKDREMIAKATGFLPRPSGTQVNVMQSTNVSATAQSTAAPPPEATIRRMVDRFNESKMLKSNEPEVIDLPPYNDEE